MKRPRLGDLLLEANLIDEVQLKIALEEQKLRGTRFGSTLIALHFIDENVLTAFLSRQLNMPCVSFNNVDIGPATLATVPRGLALRFHAVPIKSEDRRLYVAMADPMDLETIEALEAHTKMVVVPMVAPQSSIEDALRRYYPDDTSVPEGGQGGEAGLFPELVREIEEMEVFGRQFRQIHERLDRIEATLIELRALINEGRRLP